MQNNAAATLAPSADQPRFSTGELNRLDQPASIQYRTSGIKTYNQRQPRMSSSRGGNRGY